jgi:hypothetical protein
MINCLNTTTTKPRCRAISLRETIPAFGREFLLFSPRHGEGWKAKVPTPTQHNQTNRIVIRPTIRNFLTET